MVDTSAVCAEFIGTFIFVLVVQMVAGSGVSPVVAGFPIGIGLAAMVLAFGALSGGHFNPAVSTAMVGNKTIDGATYVSYLAAQFFGAFLSVAWYQGAYKNCQPKTAP